MTIRLRAITLLVVCGLWLSGSGCVSVAIEPAALSMRSPDDRGAKDALAALESGVELANEFLNSDFRKTLPAGRIEITKEGLVYRSVSLTMPITIRCTRFGDLLVACKMVAQERSWGFVVGKVSGPGDRLTHNSLFCFPNGTPVGNVNVAGTILHELTHMYCHTGLDEPGNFVQYYAEAIFLFRNRTHSMERLPYKTTDEYWAFISRMKELHPDNFSRETLIVSEKT